MKGDNNMTVNMYAVAEPNADDIKRIKEAINVMNEIINGVNKCYGDNEHCTVLSNAVTELENIANCKGVYYY